MTTQRSSHRGVDTEATRGQFLLAREQVSAHASASSTAMHLTRLRKARRRDDEIPSRGGGSHES